MVLALSANLAAADDGRLAGLDVVPYDPGLQGEVLPSLLPSGVFSE